MGRKQDAGRCPGDECHHVIFPEVEIADSQGSKCRAVFSNDAQNGSFCDQWSYKIAVGIGTVWAVV